MVVDNLSIKDTGFKGGLKSEELYLIRKINKAESGFMDLFS